MDLNGKVAHGYKLTSQWRNQFTHKFLSISKHSSNRQIKRALRSLNQWMDSNYCWGVTCDAALTTKQKQLIERGVDWMTPLGGVRSKCNIIYICTLCTPNQGAVATNGWYITTSGIVIDPFTGKANKICNARWKCPFCGGKYSPGQRVPCIGGR